MPSDPDSPQQWLREAGDGAAAERSEAELLARARHPGVVPVHELCDDGSVGTLVRHIPEGPTLDRADLSLAEMCGVFAVLGTTVADLHHLDVAVGTLDGHDVVLDREGRPVIVTLVRANYPGGPARANDVKALGMLLEASLASSTDPDAVARGASRHWGWSRHPSLRERLCRVATAAAEGRLTAHQFAAALARPEATLPRLGRPVPSGHLRSDHPVAEDGPEISDASSAPDLGAPVSVPGPDVDGPAPGRAGHRARVARRTLSLGLAMACAAAGVVLMLTGIPLPTGIPLLTGIPRLSRPHLTAAMPALRSPTLCVAVGPSGGCKATATFADGVLRSGAGSFAVGRPGDIVATGRWDCGAQPTLAVLRPDRGEIWVFDRWPADSLPVTARLAGRVAGAADVGVAKDGACDQIMVTRADGSTVAVGDGGRP